MKDVLKLSVPFSLWLVTFSGLYGLHGLFCSERWPAATATASGRLILVAAALVAVGLQLAALLVLRARPAEAPLLRQASAILAVAALAAAAWTALPVALTSACL